MAVGFVKRGRGVAGRIADHIGGVLTGGLRMQIGLAQCRPGGTERSLGRANWQRAAPDRREGAAMPVLQSFMVPPRL